MHAGLAAHTSISDTPASSSPVVTESSSSPTGENIPGSSSSSKGENIPESSSSPKGENIPRSSSAQKGKGEDIPGSPSPQKGKGENIKAWLVDKSLGSAANLSKLLPSGTTLAFYTMAPSFTKGGSCSDHDVNYWFTWWLISFLTLLCGGLSFTDSVTDKAGTTYYGIATLRGLKLFNHDLSKLTLFDEATEEEKRKRLEELKKKKKLKKRDFLHAFFSSAVFVALAFCDAGVQRCLVPRETSQWNDFLTHLPLAVGFLAAFVFMIFPSTRNGIGDDGPAPEEDAETGDAGKPAPPAPLGESNKGTSKCKSSLMAMDITRVDPRTSYEIDQVV